MPEDDIEERISRMERQFKAFTIRGSGIDVHGSMRHGFIIGGAGGSGEGGGGGSPTPATGACCVGTDCSVTTEADCATMSGVYQGDDIPCGDGSICNSCSVNGIGTIQLVASGISVDNTCCGANTTTANFSPNDTFMLSLPSDFDGGCIWTLTIANMFLQDNTCAGGGEARNADGIWTIQFDGIGTWRVTLRADIIATDFLFAASINSVPLPTSPISNFITFACEDPVGAWDDGVTTNWGGPIVDPPDHAKGYGGTVTLSIL